jgi:hypothetical protein
VLVSLFDPSQAIARICKTGTSLFFWQVLVKVKKKFAKRITLLHVLPLDEKRIVMTL